MLTYELTHKDQVLVDRQELIDVLVQIRTALERIEQLEQKLGE